MVWWHFSQVPSDVADTEEITMAVTDIAAVVMAMGMAVISKKNDFELE